MSKYLVGNIYNSNKYGAYEVIEKTDSTHYVIKFLKTGFTRPISETSMREGTIRDPYYPIYYEVACLGVINLKENKKALNIWRFMIDRCYNKKSENYKNYGALGITVCEEWLCFENFAKDLPYINGYNEEKFQNKEIVLDKDMEYDWSDKKQYCPKFCRFIPAKDNFQEALTRRKQNTSSRYVGVTKLKDGKWQASISYKSKNIYIGRYKTEEDAHKAYLAKQKELYK